MFICVYMHLCISLKNMCTEADCELDYDNVAQYENKQACVNVFAVLVHVVMDLVS